MEFFRFSEKVIIYKQIAQKKSIDFIHYAKTYDY